MSPETKSALISAFRTVLSVVAGFVFAAYIGNPIAAAGLDFTSVAIVAYWSFAEKSDTGQSAFSMIMGPLRNLAASVITYASVRGWLTPEQAAQLLPAGIAIAVALWGVEQKILAAKAKFVIPFLLVGMLALGMYGCAGSTFGGDAQQTLYNLGEDAVPVLGALDVVPALPHQACTAGSSLNTAWLAGEQIVINGSGDPQKVIQNVETAIAALVQIGLQWGITSLQHAPTHAHLLAAVQADPTPAEWAALNAQIAAGINGMHCS